MVASPAQDQQGQALPAAHSGAPGSSPSRLKRGALQPLTWQRVATKVEIACRLSEARYTPFTQMGEPQGTRVGALTAYQLTLKNRCHFFECRERLHAKKEVSSNFRRKSDTQT